MLIFFWVLQGPLTWGGPVRERTIFIEAEYRVIRA